MSEAKLIMLGDSNVGKTSLAKRLTVDSYESEIDATIGSSVYKVYLEIGDEELSFVLWDTAGQERFKSITPMYVREAKILLLMFSCAEKSSIEDLQSWYNIAIDVVDDIKVVVIGNKSDLINSDQSDEIENQLGEFFRKNNQEECFLLISCKTGNSIDVLKGLLANIIKGLDETEPKGETNKPIKLSANQSNQSNQGNAKKDCC